MENSKELFLNSENPIPETGEKSRSWSLTSVKTFEQCGFKAKLKYVLHEKERRGPAATRGTDLHRSIELFVKKEIKELPEELTFYTSFLQGITNYETYPEHSIKLSSDWNKTTGEGWVKAVLDLQVILYPKETERNPEIVSGIPPKEAIVYDWKTGKIYPEHHEQKTLYSLLTFCEWPTVQRVRAVHVYLDSRKNREEIFDRDQVQQLRDYWTNKAQRFLNALSYPDELIPNPGRHCIWCGYRREVGGPCRF